MAQSYRSIDIEGNDGGSSEIANQEEKSSNGWGRAFRALGSIIILCALILIISNHENETTKFENLAETPSQTASKFLITQHPMPPDADLWGSVQAPYPTGAWWLNLALPGDSPQPAVAYPYAVKAHDDSIAVSYSATRRIIRQKLYADIFAPDLTIGALSTVVSHGIQEYDHFSVTEKYVTEDGGSIVLYLVKGSPYVTFEFVNCAATISPLALFMSINGKVPVNWAEGRATGTEFKLVLSSGQTWMLYSSEEITFGYVSNNMAMEEPFTGILRAAMLTSDQDEGTLRRYSHVYPIGGELAYATEGDTMEMTYNWKVGGGGDVSKLLMLALPHHADIMDSDEYETVELTAPFKCIKGEMIPVIGGTWTLKDTLPTTGWNSPLDVSDLDPAWVEEILASAQVDVDTSPPVSPDPYNFGKALARLARVGLIAQSLGDEETFEKASRQIGPYLAPWLDGENPDTLLYDTVWGGIVSGKGLEDWMEDFGNGWYNDHHFHYGYLIYGAAVAIKYDPTFYTVYKEELDMLVADIANADPSSTLFPMARHKDFYDWHSWASGLFPQGNGKSQESISEAINAYYAVYLFGEATNNTDLRDWGRMLTQMELRAGRKYWQMPLSSTIYEGDGAFESNKMAGVVGALDVSCNTWFGDNFEYVHLINMMPFTPISEELLEPAFIAEEYPVLSSVLKRGVAKEWLGLIYLDEAVLEPEKAWDDVKTLKIFDSGNSMTNSLYWIATRPKNEFSIAEAPKARDDVGEQCSDHPKCAAINLVGECCPTTQGIYLGCCTK